jgi:hypothetical protein
VVSVGLLASALPITKLNSAGTMSRNSHLLLSRFLLFMFSLLIE